MKKKIPIMASLCFLVLVLSSFPELGLSKDDGHFLGIKKALGGIENIKGFQNSAEIKNLCRFAVEEHNKKENTLLEFTKVIAAKQQVVAGTMYYLTLEAVDGGKKNVYDAKVWVKPWMDFKQLQEFKPSSSP
ncbi:cysteine proteinase inhibitor A-like [Impatiens glandulifera]|uniref:cysteine proteinase inhibitor A-like n=1 Tax=Impatiens glandulifera TaxID=253017 RepID=UPI001FB15DF0|nr:cysteine proteinase inhibitor A-like [Impatiens glandulifera]